jgi:hypothetical protein
MASTYTPLGVELQATGENAGTWGTKTNTNLQLLEQITGGFTAQSIAGGAQTTALTISDSGTGDTAGHRMIDFTGTITGNQIVTIPLDVQTFYILRNSTSGAYTVQFKYASGSGSTFTFSATNKKTAIVFATANDGTNPDIIEVQTGGDVVDDTSPQLGGDLDTNSFNIAFDDAHGINDENGNEQIIFQTTSSAVNQFDITNAATGSGPKLEATGGDSNIDLDLEAKGTGHVTIRGNDNPGTIQFNCENNSHGVQVKSPAHSVGSSAVLTLPSATGNIIGSGDTGTLPLAAIDIDGGTDIGADLVDADLFIVDDGAGGTNRKVAASRIKTYIGGGTSWQAVKTSTFTAVAGEGYFVNTTSGVITMNLPAGNLGDEVVFIDYAGTFDSNTFTISANGSEKIAGSTADLTVSTERAGNTLVYTDGTQGWLLKNK